MSDNSMKQWRLIGEHIEQVTGRRFLVTQQKSMGGGCINAAFLLTGENGRQYFVKTNQAGQKAMFAAEARGLQAIASSNSVKVPGPICFGENVGFGENQAQSYIVLEYMNMNGRLDQRLLGEQLAAMHNVMAEQFGWDINNTIGATFQSNAWMDSWLSFWSEQRLGFQLKLAAQNGYGGKLQSLGEKLLVEMPLLFTDQEIKPSMLHGDLWGGNVAALNDGTPVIYDPAFYYGDREVDLAMTYLFGGFGADFYASYQNTFPLDAGFTVRKTFYNIYHVINHLNMFGGAYHGQSIQMLRQVLSEIK